MRASESMYALIWLLLGVEHRRLSNAQASARKSLPLALKGKWWQRVAGSSLVRMTKPQPEFADPCRGVEPSVAARIWGGFGQGDFSVINSAAKSYRKKGSGEAAKE